MRDGRHRHGARAPAFRRARSGTARCASDVDVVVLGADRQFRRQRRRRPRRRPDSPFAAASAARRHRFVNPAHVIVSSVPEKRKSSALRRPARRLRGSRLRPPRPDPSRRHRQATLSSGCRRGRAVRSRRGGTAAVPLVRRRRPRRDRRRRRRRASLQIEVAADLARRADWRPDAAPRRSRRAARCRQ